MGAAKLQVLLQQRRSGHKANFLVHELKLEEQQSLHSDVGT
jgi:hypothetical protein